MEVSGQFHTSEVLILQRSIYRYFILYAPLVLQEKKNVCLKSTFRFHHHMSRHHLEQPVADMEKEVNRKLHRG